MKLNKKVLIIGGIVLLLVANLILMTTNTYSAWGLERLNQGSITVLGSDAEVYTDAACTQILSPTQVLTFSSVRVGSASTPILLYLRNKGTDPVYPTATVTGLDSHMSLIDAKFGTITNATPLYQVETSYINNNGFKIIDTPLTPLAPNTVQPLSLKIQVLSGAPIGTTINFNLRISATSGY